jgi:hypothetical protein
MSQVTLPKSSISSITRAVIQDCETRFEALISKLNESGDNFDASDLRKLVVPTVDGFSNLFKAGKVAEKKRKDPNAPKKAPSPYMIFLNENRADFIQQFADEGVELVGKEKVTKVAKRAGKRWTQMTDEDKAQYIEKASALTEKYQQAMKNYKPTGDYAKSVSKSKASGKIDFNSLPIDVAPEGWSGPFENKSLWKFAAKRKFGVGKFKTFEEAVHATEALVESGEECGGITRDKTGFTLRQTTALCENKEDDPCVSWVIGNATMVQPKKAVKFTEEAKSKKKIVKKVQESVKPKKKIVQKKTKAIEKPKKKVIKKPEPKLEPKPESDDEVSVEPFTLDGVDYYLDTDSNEIYDTETQQVIGKLVDGKIVKL